MLCYAMLCYPVMQKRQIRHIQSMKKKKKIISIIGRIFFSLLLLLLLLSAFRDRVRVRVACLELESESESESGMTGQTGQDRTGQS